MPQFKAFAPDVEVNVAAIIAVVKGMGAFQSMALKILSKHGINDLEKRQWYLQQSWLDAFKEISQSMGSPVLRVIGHKIPETAIWPPEIKNIDQALESIDRAYHMNHRNGKIGNYTFTKTDEQSGKMVCDNPYPCDFDLGIIEGTVKKFGSNVMFCDIKHDTSKPCREKGGLSCTYVIKWKKQVCKI